MSKVLCLIVILSVFCISVQCLTPGEEQMRRSGDMVRSVCQPKHKITDEVALGAREGKFPEDKNFKCYVSCVVEMMGAMKKNKITYDQAVRQFSVLLPEEYKAPYQQGLDACKDATGGVKNPCDAAYNFVKCFYNNNPKFTFA